ncbi:MAG: aldehyde dehydrogenase family protein, partial [Rhizobiales bacterium]|nr:aldehyde dehydrogenase family protein [Hyphomicrobiales bacterium]
MRYETNFIYGAFCAQPDRQRNQLDAAVRSSRAAFEGAWSLMKASERGALLLKFADLIRRDEDELVRLESLDSGKPVSAVRRQDLPAVLDTLTYYAGMADKINGQVVPARPDALTYTVREPLGVVGAIIPWNFPLMIGMWKIAPALACGCTVVLKPAEVTPLTALKIGELALEAGFPAGVLNVVPGFGKVAGQALVDHPDVDKVTFTGSPVVGRQILQGAAGNLKRVTLELGGKSANIVFPDADIDAAVRSSRAAFEGAWSLMKASERGALLLKFADLIRRDEDELVRLESLDS